MHCILLLQCDRLRVIVIRVGDWIGAIVVAVIGVGLSKQMRMSRKKSGWFAIKRRVTMQLRLRQALTILRVFVRRTSHVQVHPSGRWAFQRRNWHWTRRSIHSTIAIAVDSLIVVCCHSKHWVTTTILTTTSAWWKRFNRLTGADAGRFDRRIQLDFGVIKVFFVVCTATGNADFKQKTKKKENE